MVQASGPGRGSRGRSVAAVCAAYADKLGGRTPRMLGKDAEAASAGW